MMKRIPSGGDVYLTSGGRVLRRSDKLRSCGVSDGCTIQVTSGVRGGGRHKDKWSKAQKRQVTRQESVSNKGPAILDSVKDRVIQSIEEDERYRKIVENVSERKGIEAEQQMQYWMTKLQERPGGDMMECAVRWAVETWRKERGAEEEQEHRRQEEQEQRRQEKQEHRRKEEQEHRRQEEQEQRWQEEQEHRRQEEQEQRGRKSKSRPLEQRKKVGFDEEEQSDEPEVTSRFAEVRRGRGSASLVRGGDEMCWADETSRKGKGKSNKRKGEHEGKGGGFGSKGM